MGGAVGARLLAARGARRGRNSRLDSPVEDEPGGHRLAGGRGDGAAARIAACIRKWAPVRQPRRDQAVAVSGGLGRGGPSHARRISTRPYLVSTLARIPVLPLYSQRERGR